MTRLSNGFEAGADEVPVTAGNSGMTGHDAFNSTTAGTGTVLVYDTAQKNSGNNGVRIAGGTAGSSSCIWTTSMGTKTEIWARLYINPSSFPASINVRPFRLLSGANVRFAIQIGNNQRIQVYDSANVFQSQMTTLVQTSDWNRIEVRVDATSCDVWLYTDHTSSTHDEVLSLTGESFGPSFDSYQFGLTVGTVNFPTFWLDDVAIDDTAKIGPTGGGGGGAVDFTDGVSSMMSFTSIGTLGGEVVPLTGGQSVDAIYKTTPYARLWNNFTGTVGTAMNTVGNAALMAQHYIRVHAEGPDNKVFGNGTKTGSGPTFAKRMIDAGVRWVTQYINGSYVTQGHPEEAPDLETNNPLGIAWFWPGSYSTTGSTTLNTAWRLTDDITSAQPHFFWSNAATIAPSSLTSAEKLLWPARRSRNVPSFTANTHSVNTNAFVAVIRIDDEIIGIGNQTGDLASPGGNIEVVDARRGMWGTTQAPHSANARVYSPVYVGSVTGGADTSLAGSPAVGDDGTTQPLRYCVQFGTVAGADWIGDRTEQQLSMTDPTNPWQGYNALHYDVSSSFYYNLACAYGTQVAPWNIATVQKETSQSWATNQQQKFTMHAARPGWSGLTLFGNSLHRDPQDVGILSTLDGLREGGGGTFEEFGKNNQVVVTGTTWLNEHANRVLNAFKTNPDQTLEYWTRWDRDFQGTGNTAEQDRLQRVTYATLLLGFDPTSTKYLYGVKEGMAAADPIFYWDLGPAVTSATNSIAELQYITGGSGTTHSAAGTWFISQVASAGDVTNATSRLNAALDMDGVVGIGFRIPWNVLNPSPGVFSDTLLEQGWALANAKGKKFKPRVIAGQYVPSAMRGTTVTTEDGELVPNPFSNSSGAANTTFDDAYEALVEHLADWARTKPVGKVPGVDCSWTSKNYSELYFGFQNQSNGQYGGIQGAFGGTAASNTPNFVAGNKRLIDRAYTHGDANVYMGWGLSGQGPIVDPVDDLSTYMRTKTGVDLSPRIIMQANGWGPNGEWGNTLEPQLDSAWGGPTGTKKVFRALQDIHPANGGPRSSADWVAMYGYAYAVQAVYCELYHEQAFQTPYNTNAAAFTQMQTEIADFYDSHQTGGTQTTSLYVREFANGWAIVNNSSTQSYTFQVPGSGGHVVSTSTTNQNLPASTNSVVVPAGDARLVVKPGSAAESPAPIVTTSSGTTLLVTVNEQSLTPLGVGPGGGVGEPQLSLVTVNTQTATMSSSDLGPEGGVGSPAVVIDSTTYFLPPAEITYYSARDVPETSSMRYRAFTRSYVGIDVDINGTIYRGGMWAGPLTPQEIADIVAAGYADRLAVVDNPGEFPILDN